MPTDKKLSDLPVATAISSSDISVLVDNGVDYQYTFTLLLQFLEANLSTGSKISFGTILPQNTTGANGDVFVNTSAGSFAQKISGAWAVVYTLPAANGADGTLLYGAGMPGTSVGKNSDSYINTLTGIFYQKNAGVWSQVFSMATGPQGPRGVAGTNGTNGVNGNTILFGTADPSNTATGSDGNFYINTTTYKLFGPKTSGVWGSGVSLIGAGVPGGGAAGQILAKADGTDFNTIWEDHSFANLSGQPADNINMAAALNTKVDKVTGFGLSSNDYTSAEKTKLASLTKHYQGKYSSLSALQAAIPTGTDGDYAIVVSSPNDQEYIWDSDHTAWVVTENIPASTFAALGGSPSDNTSLNSALNAKENTANKDAVNGYAGLDSGGNFTKTTDNLNEGSSNLYFTAARVLSAILTGIGFSTATAVLATDTILQAIGKLQAQITTLFKIPAGGTAGQVLFKIDGTDGNVQWASALLAGNNLSDLGSTQTALSNLGLPAGFKVTRTVSATINQYIEIGQITEPVIDIHGNGLTTMRLKVIISADGSPTLTSLTAMEFDIAPHFWIGNGSWIKVTPTVRTGLGTNAIIYTELQAYYTNVGDGNGYLKLRLNNTTATNAVATTFNVSIYVYRPSNCGFTPLTGTGTDATIYPGYGVNIWQDYNLNNLWLYASNGVNVQSILNLQTALKLNGASGSTGQVPVNGGSSSPMTWGTPALIVANIDFAAQTANKTIATFMVGTSTAYFRIGGYINISAVATNVIQLQVVYTDENSSARTGIFYSQGTTTPGLSAIGNSSYPTMDIRCKNGSTITVSATLTTSSGSITYDCGARIQQL